MSRPTIADHVQTAASSTRCQEQREHRAEPVSKPAGNFVECEILFEQPESTNEEIGKPGKGSSFPSKKRVGRCPASHNRALLD